MRRRAFPPKIVDGASCEESNTPRSAVSIRFRFDMKKSIESKNYNRVRFSSVHVREYDLCLGDNPSVARGAPISLDWTYRGSGSCFPLDDYEKSQPSSSNNKRECGRGSSHPLKLPSLERLHILRDLGYSRQEIKQATDEIQKSRRRRLRTMRQVQRAECVRSIARRFFRLFSRSHKPTMDRSTRSSSTTRSSTEWPGSTRSVHGEKGVNFAEERYLTIETNNSKIKGSHQRVDMTGNLVMDDSSHTCATEENSFRENRTTVEIQETEGRSPKERQDKRQCIPRDSLDLLHKTQNRWWPKLQNYFQTMDGNRKLKSTAIDGLDVAHHKSVRL